MTLPEELEHDLETLSEHWPQAEMRIRDHMLSQDASITNLRSAAQKAVLANADLRSRLAAADALLQFTQYQWPNLNEALHNAIGIYLQGASDEIKKLAEIEVVTGVVGLLGTGWLTPWLDLTRFGPALFIQSAVFLLMILVGISSLLTGG